MEKVGRNDPCPCGSGKKYKQCHMGKDEEQKKTYTPQGKRKFKATVLGSTEKTQGLFQSRPQEQTAPSTPYVFLKFKQTEIDYRAEPLIEPLPYSLQLHDSTEIFAMPHYQKQTEPNPPEIFEMTSENYQS